MSNNVMLNAKTLSVIIVLLIVAEVVILEGVVKAGIQGIGRLFKRRLPYKVLRNRLTTTTTFKPDEVYIEPVTTPRSENKICNCA